MGVHGLWQLVHPSGRAVTLESLEGKVLAVDVSIWLHQTMKGMRDKDGNALPNAHLQGLFSRVCKLLFYRIKPVFVFDGGVPTLKKQTLAARRERKSEAQRESHEIAQKLLRNLVKSQAVKRALGGGDAPVRVPGVRKKGGEADLFELPPLPESEEIGLALNSGAWEAEFEQQENWVREGLATLSKVDPDSEEFKSLPMEIQHEALVDLKEERKFHSLSRISKMPEDADSFSSYQLKKLMKVSNLTTRIEDVRKQMANKTTDELQYELGEDYYGDEVEARRIVSEDASHYILIKGMSKQKQMEEAEKYEIGRKVKVERDDEFDTMQNEEAVESKKSDREKPKKSEKGFAATKRRGKKRNEFVGRERLKRESKNGNGNQNCENITVASTTVSDKDNDMGGQDDDAAGQSSSEDEGFIEVAFDPSNIVQEDDLFPASIFATNVESEDVRCETPDASLRQMDDGQGVSVVRNKELDIAKKHLVKEKKGVCWNEMINQTSEVDDSPRTLPLHDTEMVFTKPDLAEKRKSVLSDIRLELEKKKEALNSLSIDDDSENEVEERREGRNKEGENEMDEHHLLPGGFLLDESVVDDKGDVIKNDDIRNRDDNSTGGVSDKDFSCWKRVSHGMNDDFDDDDDDDDDHVSVMSSYNKANESEEEDLKLAIELSLQTARDEKLEEEVKRTVKSKTEEYEVEDVELKDGNLEDERDDDESDDDDFEMVESGEEYGGTEKNDGFVIASQEEGRSQENSSSTVTEKFPDGVGDITECPDPVSSTTTEPSIDMSQSQRKAEQERLQPEDVDDPFLTFTQNNLENIHEALASERAGLLSEQGKQLRFASSLTDQIVLEAQELLELFGIPYIVSPMEAEAQCAFLDATQQTQGTITDDSDIWLFGGTRVYKNFFNQNKYVEFFTMDSINSHFGLSREQLINVALLCGSDYTMGLQGVGPVRALEIMGEFPGDGLSGLNAFRKWWDRSQKHRVVPGENKLRTRMRELTLDSGFPRQEVMEAYLVPVVDESREQFSWAQPDVDLLRQFAKVKFGWSKDKIDSILDPMMKQFFKKQTQGRIHSYFQRDSFVPASVPQSDRLKKALSLVQSSLRPEMMNERDVVGEGDGVRKRVRDGKDSVSCDAPKMVENKKERNKKNIEVVSEKKTSKEEESMMETITEEGRVSQKGAVSDGNRRKNDKKIGKKKARKSGKGEMSVEMEFAGESETWENVEVKKEKMENEVDKNEDSFMKEMKGRVAAATSLLAKDKVRKKGGGAGLQRKSVKTLSLPSLEMRSSRRRVPRGRGGRSTKAAVNHVSVCLSESSSNGSSDDDVHDADDDTNDKDEDSKCGLQSQNTSTQQDPKTTACRKIEDENIPKSRAKYQEKIQDKVQYDGKVGQNLNPGLKRKIPLNTKVPKDKQRLTSVKDSVHTEDSSLSESSYGFPTKPEVRRVEDNDRESGVEIQVEDRVADVKKLLSSESKTRSRLAEVVSQVPGKNPDVSVINALTLKSTLSYLNQRSTDEKHLLNVLGGKRSANAVERRLEEEERRGKRVALQDERSKVIKKYTEGKRSEPTPTFEEMLSGAEVVKLTKPKDAGAKKKSVGDKKGKLSEGDKETMRHSDDMHVSGHEGQNEKTTNLTEKRTRARMRSFSDDFSLETKERTETRGVVDKEKSLKEVEPKSHRSEKSRAFDVPICDIEEDVRRDKFCLQVHHLTDSQSVKGHGIVPSQNTSLRGRAIAGKGKGIGKNRDGRRQVEASIQKSGGSLVPGVVASSGVTEADILEYQGLSLDDLGSDFSEDDF